MGFENSGVEFFFWVWLRACSGYRAKAWSFERATRCLGENDGIDQHGSPFTIPYSCP